MVKQKRRSGNKIKPPAHAQSLLAGTWCHEVEKRTERRVKVQYYAGQTLTKAKQTYDAVARGVADVGISCFSSKGHINMSARA